MEHLNKLTTITIIVVVVIVILISCAGTCLYS